MPEIKGKITGHKRTAKTLRLISGRIDKPNKPLFADIAQRMIREEQANITAQDLFLKEPRKDRVRGQLFNSLKVIRNTGKQVTVGPGKGGFFGKWLHHGAGYSERMVGKQTHRKGGARIKPKPWAYISDALVDWATDQIADYATGEDLE